MDISTALYSSALIKDETFKCSIQCSFKLCYCNTACQYSFKHFATAWIVRTYVDQDENTQLQGMKNADPGTIRKGLIELQEKEADLSYIWEHIVPKTQAALTQVGYYKKSGVLMRGCSCQ